MRKSSIVFILFFCLFGISAQVINKALYFDNNSSIVFRAINEMNHPSVFTFQTWININKWEEKSSLFVQYNKSGEFCELRFGDKKNGTIEFVNQGKIFRFDNSAINEQRWYQLTLIFNRQLDEKVTLYVNGNKIKLTSAVPYNNTDKYRSQFILGKNFKGLMDEIRLWKKDISRENFLLQNTLNHYHPDYKFLVAYWKGDQTSSLCIYDFCGQNHGKPTQVSIEEVTDNPHFRYRLVSGYTTFNSMFSREVERETYLLTNDLIVLSGKTTPEGEVSFGPSDESAVSENVTFLPQYKNRKGVLNFDGQKSILKLPATALPLNAVFSFGAWIYIDEWKKDAYIVRKQVNEIEQFSIQLDQNNQTNCIKINLSGNSLNFPTRIKTGLWQYISVSSTYDTLRHKAQISFGLMDKDKNIESKVQTISTGRQKRDLSNAINTIGEGFSGKIDEISFWVSDRSKNMKEDANGIPVARIGYMTSGNYLDVCHAYWKCDDESQPGLDSFSWTNLVQILRSAYEGYTGYRIRASFSGGGEKNWELMVRDTTARKIFANGIAELMKNPLLDGIDLDFEWCYNDSCWENYSETIAEVRKLMPVGKLFTVTPHVVAYKLTESAIGDVDFALFQNYGPSPERFKFNDFKTSLGLFREQGYPDNKIVLSTSTTTSKGLTPAGTERRPNAYREIVKATPLIAENTDSATVNGYTHWINSVDQTRQRARFVVDENLAGIMYWDMGCDVSPDNHLSIVRAINSEISSNVVPFVVFEKEKCLINK